VADDVLISCEGVSKKFCRSLKRSLWYGAADMAREVAGAGTRHDRLRKDEFWAVDDVSFELRRGECLGLVGRNGAGKTTLLKVLNGLIKPDSGSIALQGKVGALIALGAGFNPILTGRENIYINGSILGLTKREIHDKMEEIIDFAEIRDFVDSPVQCYSSGMNVRLGFAVAASMNPDILVVDEVLAVGDSAFKVRCYNRIREMLPRTAVILVSHSMFDIVRTCTRVMVMRKGAIRFHGGVAEGIHIYNELNVETGENETQKLVIHKDNGIEDVQVDHFTFACQGLDTAIDLGFSVHSKIAFGESRIRLVFFDDSETPVAEWDSAYHNVRYDVRAGRNDFHVVADRVRLRSGTYRIAVVLTDPLNRGYTVGIEHGLLFRVRNGALAGAPYKI
jgi:lipopolysaccharide transport system ATP-binding protein